MCHLLQIEAFPGYSYNQPHLKTTPVDLLSQTQSPRFMDEKTEASWLNWHQGMSSGLVHGDHTQYILLDFTHCSKPQEPLFLGCHIRVTIIKCLYSVYVKCIPNSTQTLSPVLALKM